MRESLLWKEKVFDLVAYENSFEVGIFNYGETSSFEIRPLSPKGLEVFVEKQILKLSKNQNKRVKITFEAKEFDTPLDYLSFRTIVVSFKINENFVIPIGRDWG